MKLPSPKTSPVTIDLPSDKSLTHRALIFAGLAAGVSQIVEPLTGEDCLATIACLRHLGCEIDLDANARRCTIRSPGQDGLLSPTVPLNFANSGTTARLFMGMLSALPDLFAVGFGDSSLSKRPMERVAEPLRSMGAAITGRQGGRLLPFAVTGRRLRPFDHRISIPSAQVKSALLIAGLGVDGNTSVELPAGSRDHTERLLRTLGANIVTEEHNGLEHIVLTGPFIPSAFNAWIPRDPSAAAFFCLLAALQPGRTFIFPRVLKNPTRTGFLKVLEAMGFHIEWRTEDASSATEIPLEETATLAVTVKGILKGTEVPPADVPRLIDELPILFALAACAHGSSTFSGIDELRHKESDRLERSMALLQAAGGSFTYDDDQLTIQGRAHFPQPFEFNPHGDHRLAMTAAILSVVAKGPCFIQNADCVNVSYPSFFRDLAYATS